MLAETVIGPVQDKARLLRVLQRNIGLADPGQNNRVLTGFMQHPGRIE